MDYKFPKVEPQHAYISNNLVLPKGGLNLKPIKAALTFQYGEEDVFDEDTGDLIGTRPSEMHLWDENRHHLIVPREFIEPDNYREFGFEFIDRRPVSFPRANIGESITMRDADQEAAFHALISNDSGTLNLACGRGKTILALKLAGVLKVPTIIVVNTTALFEQWKEEIGKFLEVSSIGTIQGKTFDWEHPIVICMVHTLSYYRELWPMRFRKHFGLVFYDEGHHMSAPVFVRSADLFFGKRFSLTATATRTDGLQSVYQYHLGRVIHKNLSQDLIPNTIFHRLKWEFDPRYKNRIIDSEGDVSLPRVRTYLGELHWRNALIVKHMLQDLKAGRRLLVLSHSVDHVGRLADLLRQSSEAVPGVITGATPQGERMGLLRDRNPVIGTFQLAREGLNKPSLDTLYITTPFSSSNDTQQAWGRIQRKYQDKQLPLVRVYEDLAKISTGELAFSVGERSCRSLRTNLKSMDYPYQLKNIIVENHDV